MKKPDAVKMWLEKIERAGDHEKDWRKDGERIVKRYRDGDGKKNANKTQFNILYSNTETLKGILYQRPPIPDVRRRYNSKDPVGRLAAEVLGKALTYGVDAYGLDDRMRQAVMDEILPGRAVLKVKYLPTVTKATRQVEAKPVDHDKSGKPLYVKGAKDVDGTMMVDEEYEQVTYEQIGIDYVDWRWFRCAPAPRWEKVQWIAFGDALTRSELIEQFPQYGKQVQLMYCEDGNRAKEGDETKKGDRALVWTVWNKLDKKVYVVTEGYKEDFLEVLEDPLKLEGFFPTPKPLYSIETTDTLIPIPEYTQYEAQAQELDELVERRRALVKSLRRRGVYDGSVPELQQLVTLTDNKFVPVTNMASLNEKGGLEKAFQEQDLSPTAVVIAGITQEIENCKSVIYEATGLSDILRGESDPNETAAAQNIKAQYGNSRISPRQTEIQRFARDVLRLCAEIMSEHFSAETLAAMTGVEVATAEQKAQAVAQARQAGNPQAIQQASQMVTWDDVMQLLKNEKLRGFRIDVETDSTIASDDQAEKKNAAEMVTAIGNMAGAIAPLVQTGVVGPDFGKAVALFGVRKFRASKDIEEQLENAQPPQPNRTEEIKAETEKINAQSNAARTQADIELDKEKMLTERQKRETEKMKAQADLVGQASANPMLAASLMANRENEVQQITQVLMQFTQQVNQALSMISQGTESRLAQLQQSLEGIQSFMVAPKTVVRDETGQVVGVQQGEMLQRVARDDAGNIVGLVQ